MHVKGKCSKVSLKLDQIFCLELQPLNGLLTSSYAALKRVQKSVGRNPVIAECLTNEPNVIVDSP